VATLHDSGRPGSPTGHGSTTTRHQKGGTATVAVGLTPRGWVPVDYGLAQISVPSKWSYSSDPCPGEAPGNGLVDLELGQAPCPTEPGLPRQGGGGPEAVLAWAPTGGKVPRWIKVNGIDVEVWSASPESSRYVVPALDFSMNLIGAAAQPVLRTLTRSPRAVVLAGGPPPSAPADWIRVRVGGVSLAVPPSWLDTGRPYSSDVWGWLCESWAPSLPVASPRLVVDTDKIQGSSVGCGAAPPPLKIAPTAGLIVDLTPRTHYWPGGGGTLEKCLRVSGIRACPVTGPHFTPFSPLTAVDILYVWVVVPHRSDALLLELGLAGDGETARTVLYSLRSATG
jgi:hypothetical protein